MLQLADAGLIKILAAGIVVPPCVSQKLFYGKEFFNFLLSVNYSRKLL